MWLKQSFYEKGPFGEKYIEMETARWEFGGGAPNLTLAIN